MTSIPGSEPLSWLQGICGLCYRVYRVAFLCLQLPGMNQIYLPGRDVAGGTLSQAPSDVYVAPLAAVGVVLGVLGGASHLKLCGN